MNGKNLGGNKAIFSTVSAHDDPIRSILCWEDNNNITKVATASKDQTIKLWSIDKKKKSTLQLTISDTHVSSVEVLCLLSNNKSNNIISGETKNSDGFIVKPGL